MPQKSSNSCLLLKPIPWYVYARTLDQWARLYYGNYAMYFEVARGREPSRTRCGFFLSKGMEDEGVIDASRRSNIRYPKTG